MTGRPLVEMEEILHASASEIVGFDDFGDDYYREGLGRLLFDLERSASDWRSAARFAAHGALVGRLYSQRGWTDRPDVLSVSIQSPVVIVGIPRTGTTLLHKMLSLHDGFQVLQNWLVQNPMVRPRREIWSEYPEYKAATAFLDSLPDHVDTSHFMAPDEADECLLLMAQSFVSNMFGSTNRLPTYDEWFLAEDMVPSFRRYADNLRLIGADEPQLRWLLKNPSNALAMREFLTVFADAKVVWMHRRPVEAMGSLVNMLSKFASDAPGDRAKRELRVWGEAMRRTENVRSRREDDFYDVEYRHLAADPVGTAMSVCRWLGMQCTSEIEDRMRLWLKDNPPDKHGVHRYDPGELGVTDEAVRNAFEPYIARYGLE
jgi:hypothetical protein